MRITFVNQKGGVGKSTAALLVGSALHAASCSVSLEDHDQQGSLSWWARQVGKLPVVSDGGDGAGEIVIADTPGHLDLSAPENRSMMSNLLSKSDRIILVSEMSTLSIHASGAMATLIGEVKPGGAKAYVLFNKVRKGTVVGQQDRTELAASIGLVPLQNFLPLCSVYEQAASFGWNVVTGKERETVVNLAMEVLK